MLLHGTRDALEHSCLQAVPLHGLDLLGCPDKLQHVQTCQGLELHASV
jgi:hypothetical protein